MSDFFLVMGAVVLCFFVGGCTFALTLKTMFWIFDHKWWKLHD